MSHQQMLDLLKRVNLTGHGYMKEENKKLVRLPGSDKKIFEKSLLFYKETSCSHGLQKVDRELQQLLPGNFQCLFSLLRKANLYKISYECPLLIFKLLVVVSGIFNRDLVKKINKEIDSKNLTEMKRCKVGLEVHFKEAEGCGGSKNKSRRRKKRGCSWCVLCWNAALANWLAEHQNEQCETLSALLLRGN